MDFSKFSDKDFFSDKFTHIYISGLINENKINNLINEVRNANKLENLKPILIHISSMGGILQDGIKLLSIFKISKLPIVTIIDNYCFSIATLLLINSSYRLMTKYSFCLLHEYRISGYINDGRQGIINYINKIDNYFKSIIELYLKNTKFTKEELNELLEHNLLLDYKYCLKKGIVDRIIDYEFKSISISKYNKNNQIINLLNDININNITISCKLTNKEIDSIINNININYNTIIYTNYSNCNSISYSNNNFNNINHIHNHNENKDKDEDKDEDDKNKDKDKDKDEDKDEDEDDKNKKEMELIFNSFNLISKIKKINTYKYGIIDVPISIENLLPLLYTNKIIMYSHTYIICNLLYSFHNYSLLLDDNIKNTNMIVKKIKEILKRKTKMSNEDINKIDKKFLIIDSKKAKELGLCNIIIDS